MKICVMQPYFIPYPGYYLLHKYVDTFVIFDDVQFNRKGFVHRNKLIINQNISWLTLPLKKKDRSAKIFDLEFNLNSQIYNKFCNKIKLLLPNPNLSFIEKYFLDFNKKPIDYIIDINKKIIEKLDIKNNFILSSQISDKKLNGEKKIIDICKKLEATEYFNLPGGEDFYDKKNFLNEKIKINFLPEFIGDKISIINYFLRDDNFKI